MEEHYPFTLPPVPINYDALESEISSRTMHFHHDKHFAAYVDNLNQLLKGEPAYQKWPLKKLYRDWAQLPAEIRQGVRNNAGGVLAHDLYFQNLCPPPVSAPVPPLDGAIVRSFGSLEKLKAAMRNAALSQFGSGWVWLCADRSGELSIVKTANQDVPLPLEPLLCCDVWEHAYYLDTQNRRAEYFDRWWRCICWPRVSHIYEIWISKRIPIPQP